MTFANPEWLWVLCVLPLLAALRVRSHVLGRRGAPGLVSPRLRGSLIVGNNLWLRWATFTCQLLALGLLVTALARPRWGFEEGETATEGRNLLIAIDTSRSMLANDLQPDRLTRAKLAAMDIMQALPEDRIGLVAFAGRAFLSAPLTIDHDAVAESIEQMDTEIIPRGGTNLVAPVELALETFDKAGTKDSALIIFSDGEDLEGSAELEKVREQAVEAGMIIVAVGVGTEQGTVIPDAKAADGFVKDDAGNVVRSRLNPTALQAVSAGTGIYLNLGSNSAMTSVVTSALTQVEKTLAEGGSGQRPIERFMWPLGFSVICFLVAFLLPDSLRFIRRLRAEEVASRTAAKAAIVLAALSWAPSAEANMSAETPAYVALTDEKFDEAIERYEEAIERARSERERAWLNLGLGSAAYRTGDYDRAKLAWGDTLREGNRKLTVQAHYNLGNALFREGREMLDAAGFVFPGEEVETPEVASTGGLNQLLIDQLKSLGLEKISAESLEQVLRAVSLAPQTSPDDRDQINNILLALKGGAIDVETVVNGLMDSLGMTAMSEPLADPNANIDIAPTVEQWLSAIEHYDAALKIDPKNDDAQRNIEVVRSYLEAVQPPEPPQNEDEQEEEQEDEEEEQEDEPEEEEEEEEKEEEKEDEQDQEEQDEENEDEEENQDDSNDENQPEDQPENPEGDGEDEQDQPEGDQPQEPESPEGGEQPPPEDPNEDPGESEESPESGEPSEPPPGGEDGEPQESEPQDPSEGQPDEQDGEPGEEQESDQGGQPPGQQPQPPAQPGEPEEAPPEGELEANGGSAPPPQPASAGQPAQVDPAEMQTNPETGFSPSQARNYLQNLSDEDFEVRPLVPMGSSKAEKFKNW